ncbi:MAG TPA: hypothetical protein PKW80_04625 [Bacteroidales bacterium]|nr:hypothetical protein [Bacteroidales bacterium]
MLLKTFFNILDIKTEGEKTLAQVELIKDHKIYEGHFPQNPVAPGVCLIQMIRETLEVCLEKKIMLETADEIKFINIVNPVICEILTIEINKRPKAASPLAFSIIITGGEIIYFKMKAEFKECNSLQSFDTQTAMTD